MLDKVLDKVLDNGRDGDTDGDTDEEVAGSDARKIFSQEQLRKVKKKFGKDSEELYVLKKEFEVQLQAEADKKDFKEQLQEFWVTILQNVMIGIAWGAALVKMFVMSPVMDPAEKELLKQLVDRI